MADISFTNLPAFERDLRRELKDRLQPEFAIILKKVAFTLGTHLIFGTPVDFGDARGDWQTRLGSPANSQANRQDPGGSAAIAQMNAVLGRIQDADPYQVVWYFNNAPYIDTLDQGGFRPANPATDEAALARRRTRRSPKTGSARCGSGVTRARRWSRTGTRSKPRPASSTRRLRRPAGSCSDEQLRGDQAVDPGPVHHRDHR